MNNNYRGNYKSTFVLGTPESFLINFYTQGGTSGAPIFQKNNDNCIGLIMGSTGSKNQYTITLSNFNLSWKISSIPIFNRLWIEKGPWCALYFSYNGNIDPEVV